MPRPDLRVSQPRLPKATNLETAAALTEPALPAAPPTLPWANVFAHPANPVPSQPTVWLARASDGVDLRFVRWRPTARRSRGTVLVAQGRAEFIERYFETVADLRRRGFHVITFDWRGQGGSARQVKMPRKGHVASLRDYQIDLETALGELKARMPEPHFALAHSMGGAVLLEAAMRGQLPVERLVTVAPMIDLAMITHPRLARLLTTLLYWTGFGRSFVPGGGATAIATLPFAGNRLTADPQRYARNAELSAAAPHLAIGAPTVAWLRTAYQLMDRLSTPEAPLSVRQPVLVIGAGDDPIVATRSVEIFASRLKTGSALVLPLARHEILMETDDIRARFWAAFDAFVPGERFAEAGVGAEAGSASPRRSGRRRSGEKAKGGFMGAKVT
jgi:lysophospholipase